MRDFVIITDSCSDLEKNGAISMILDMLLILILLMEKLFP